MGIVEQMLALRERERTPSMTRYTDIIARLKEAKGLDRQLNRLIEETHPGVLRHPYASSVEDGYVISGQDHETYTAGQGYLPRNYTGSLNTAMTLIPEGHVAEIWSGLPGADDGTPSAELHEWQPADDTHHDNRWRHLGKVYAATPALALLIAIMEAREGMDND